MFLFFNKHWVQVELSSPQQRYFFGNFINSCRLISQYTIDQFTLFNASNELLYLENILKLSFLLDWHVSDRASEKISHLNKICFLSLRKWQKCLLWRFKHQHYIIAYSLITLFYYIEHILCMIVKSSPRKRKLVYLNKAQIR